VIAALLALSTGGLALRLALALLPVCLFLASLVYLDSYKLVSIRSILKMIGAGGLAALASYVVNVFTADLTGIDQRLLTTVQAPLVEEILKAVPILLMIRAKRVGFLVDAAIFGFAVGTGFALVENVYYLRALPDASLGLWIVRGFGTAVMHGGSTAIVGTVTRAVIGRQTSTRSWFVAPGLLAAYLLHALFNSFLVPPVVAALIVTAVFPVLLLFVFGQSESYLRSWLGSGFDLDSELIETINSGQFTSSPAGQYLQSLREHFSGAVLADMLCLLRIHAELSLRAKGILMMREAGFPVKRDAEIDEKLEELRYLEKAIGRTGELAIAPVLHTTANDVWQLRMLESA
jgi:RsiW-degrading membrane proteinase PrsW (M82 family)